MSIDFVKMKESENLIPIEIPNKYRYLMDLLNVENNFSGRLDSNIPDIFIHEAVQLIKNSIFLFEKGYFDCAFYSLRQSLEISTTMVFLTDIDDNVNVASTLKKWKEKDRFPMYNEMMRLLEEKGEVFKDIKKHLAEYFDEINDIKKEINKYVHKQGQDTFYTTRNHPLNKRNDGAFLLEFEKYLKKSIGTIAIFRLMIDPFPILLMDEEIYHRTGDLMSIPYSNEFVSKYIGGNFIDSYKLTDFYQNYYSSIIHEEKKASCVSKVVKNQYIDKEEISEILKQSHLLYKSDQIAVVMAGFSEKVCRIYFGNGTLSYFTSTNSNRKDMGSSGLRFKKILDSGVKYNNEYDEAHLSVLKINGDNLFLEHNGELNEKEISELEKIVEMLEEKWSTT